MLLFFILGEWVIFNPSRSFAGIIGFLRKVKGMGCLVGIVVNIAIFHFICLLCLRFQFYGDPTQLNGFGLQPNKPAADAPFGRRLSS